MKTTTLVLVLLMILFVGVSFTALTSQNPWPVPDKYKKMPNPVKGDAEATKGGKALWAKHCQSCHGKSGKGDGPKAAQLKTLPGDFTKAETQAETDGELFYKTSEGREDMPSFKKKIPDQEDIWSIVNYVREFKQ